MLTDYFGLEVGVVEVGKVHHDVVEADDEGGYGEDCRYDETILVESRLAVTIAISQAPLWRYVRVDGHSAVLF